METQPLYYTWIPCTSSHYTKGRAGAAIESIILHSTDGSKDGDIATLSGKTERLVSVHWYVTRKGEIYHFVQDSDTAWHAGKVRDEMYDNHHSIGIEQEHYDYQEEWPAVQIEAAARLIVALRQKHGVDLPVKSHAYVARPAGRKNDPARYPWADLAIDAKRANETEWVLTARP